MNGTLNLQVCQFLIFRWECFGYVLVLDFQYPAWDSYDDLHMTKLPRQIDDGYSMILLVLLSVWGPEAFLLP